jgi:O-antigen ligase
MIYLLVGYMWLFIHRPFEVWPVLAPFRIELVYAVFCFICWLVLNPNKSWVSNRLNVAFAFFWLVFLMAWLASPYARAGQPQVEEYFKYVYFYFLLMATARDERDLRTLAAGYLLVVGLYMTHSLREFLCGRHVYRMGIPRMIGIDESFNDPNTFAATILYSLPLTLAFWPEAKNRKHKLLLAYYTGLTVLCVIFTGSRSGFAVLLVFFVLVLPRLFFSKRMFAIAVVSLPLVWFAMPEDLQNRFWTLIDPSVGPRNAQGSAESRTIFFFEGLALWQGSPVLGVGPAGFSAALAHHMQPHNLYAQVLAETGTLGAMAVLGLLACYLLNVVEIRRLGRQDKTGRSSFPANLSNAIIISIVLLLIKGLGDHNLYRYTWLWFGAFQAIAVKCMWQRVALSRPAQPFPMLGRVPAASLTIGPRG